MFLNELERGSSTSRQAFLIPLEKPKNPDPDGAAATPELLGGKFGEMSTLNNYLRQSFGFELVSTSQSPSDVLFITDACCPGPMLLNSRRGRPAQTAKTIRLAAQHHLPDEVTKCYTFMKDNVDSVLTSGKSIPQISVLLRSVRPWRHPKTLRTAAVIPCMNGSTCVLPQVAAATALNPPLLFINKHRKGTSDAPVLRPETIRWFDKPNLSS